MSPSAATDVASSASPRARVLRALGATEAEVDALLEYGANRFAPVGAGEALPLADEPFAATWARWADEAAERGAWAVLGERLPQLRFAVAAGMSDDPAYRRATRTGAPVPPGTPPLPLRRPDALTLAMYASPAGRVPVLRTPERDDFALLVQALARRNEPVPVPRSMGACMVAGYVNWARVAARRAEWVRDGGDGTADRWRAALAALPRSAYQDCVLLAVDGPYSGVPAVRLGLDESTWLATSATIRLEHECMHYLTRRVLGRMANTMLDELLADYAGVTAAVGRFRADWCLAFLGLDDRDGYRAGGRLENYRGAPPLSDGAFAVLQTLVRHAVLGLARLDAERPEGVLESPAARGARLVALARGATLESLAAVGGA